MRVLARDPDDARSRPGKGTIAARFARAAELRRLLFGAALPQAMRVFTGESEGLPGVTVDRYGDFVVVQWLSGGRAPLARRALRRHRGDAGSRAASTSSAGCGRSAGGGPPEPAVRARGDEAPLELVVEDGGCRFGVDVTAPLGVGLFPDMRLGWAAVAARAAGRRVLNLFSYTGAFSVHAAKAGAREVVAVDVAPKAHARARRNYELSGLDRRAPRDADRRRDQDAGAVRVARARVRHRRLRSADVLARPGGAVLGRARSGAGSRARARPCSSRAGLLVFATNSTKLSSAELDRALGEGARGRARRAAHRRARRAAARLSGRPRLPRGQLPQARDRDPRPVVAST